MNDDIHPRLLKLKKRNKKSDLLLDELKNKALYPVNNKRVIPIVTGYFPEDFSLNIYRSTSLYKKRYQIEPFKLKGQLKIIKTQKKSKIIDNIIKSIKKKEKENCISSDLLRLLKSNKIDTFAKRYLEKYKFQSKTNINKILPKKKLEKLKEDKIGNADLIINTLVIESSKKTNFNNINLSEDNLAYKNQNNKTKNNMINSSSQTNFVNDFKGYNFRYKIKHKFIERPLSSRTNNILNNYYLYDSLSLGNNPLFFFVLNIYWNSWVNSPFNKRNIHNRNKNNKIFKNNFSEKKNKKIKLFFTKKIKSALNKNINNQLDKNKKLIFSFYDSNDKDIKLFEKSEKKLKEFNSINKNKNEKVFLSF